MNNVELILTISPYIVPYLLNPTKLCYFLYKGYKWINPEKVPILIIHETDTMISDTESAVLLTSFIDG